MLSEVKHSRVSKLRFKESPIDDSQWGKILSTVLLQEPHDPKDSVVTILEDLEVVSVITGQQLIITFRRNISGIYQKVGEIILKKDESQEIDAVAWGGTAVARASSLEDAAKELTQKLEDHKMRAQKLEEQLEDLIQAKAEHEDNLMEKLRDLLNEKKLKIRDQQRLLATAKVNPSRGNVPSQRPCSLLTFRQSPRPKTLGI